jgi:acyl carrier protein
MFIRMRRKRMKRDPDFEKVVDLVAKMFGVNKTDISERTSFGDFDTDSVDMADFIIHDVGAAFNLNISRDEVWNINTVRKLYDVIKSKQYQ